MRIGTKSLLYGAHQFILHPLILALAWWRLFGFPWDPRLWVCFVVHDLGYFGKHKMDDEEGERHPYFGARVMGLLFNISWYSFSLYHSRFLARKIGTRVSALCVADKFVLVITPWWLYLPLVRMTGEIREYQSANKHVKEVGEHVGISWDHDRRWYADVQRYMATWVETTIRTRDFNPWGTRYAEGTGLAKADSGQDS